MKRKYMKECLLGAFTIVVSLCFFSCGDDDEEEPKNKPEEQEFVAKNFEVTLENTSGSGFEWVWMNKAEAAADSVRHDYYADGKVGGKTTHIWLFQTKKEGADSLVFHYMQPWEPDNVENTYVHHFEK